MTEEVDRYARVHEILDGARQLSGAERTAFLAEQCDGDESLRTEVQELLEAGLENPDGDPFAEGNVSGARIALETVLEKVDSTWLPDKIGDYTVTRQIGQGGMGVVYEAEQESPRRLVAIKLLHPMLATESRLHRFRHEAEILGRLQHPGIAQIFEASTYDVGRGPQPFFAMQLVRGVDIRSYCEENDLDRNARLELLARVADAVQYAHEQGVIHRDLKPDNVLVNRRGQPQILDFGIARTSSNSATLSTVMTEDGQLVGTLAYMAPEQLTHSAEMLTPRADVYALGVMAFELLLGRLPHAIDDLSITQAIEVLSKSEAPRASSIDAGLRGDIDTILCKALEPDPDRRYASAAALAGDIRRYLDDLPVEARPPTKLYLAQKFTRRNKTLVIGALTTLVTLLAGGIIAVILGAHAREQRDLAQVNENLAVNGILQSTQVLLDAGRDRDAVSQLRLVPKEARGLAWRLLDRAVPFVVNEAAGIWTFTDDEHLVGVGRDSLLLYSLSEHKTVRTLFRERGIAGVVSASPAGIATVYTQDETLLIDLNSELVMEESPRFVATGKWGRARWPEVSDDGRTVVWYTSANEAELRIDGEVVRSITGLSYRETVHLAPDGRRLCLNRSGEVLVIDVDSGAPCFRHQFNPDQVVTGFPVLGGVLLVDGTEGGHDGQGYRRWTRIALRDDGQLLEVEEPFAADSGYGRVVPSPLPADYSFAFPRDGRFVALQRIYGTYLLNMQSEEELRFEGISGESAASGGFIPFIDSGASIAQVSPSGRRLAICSGYAQPMVVELDERLNDPNFDPRMLTLRGHRGPNNISEGWIYHHAVSQDGSLIASSAPYDSLLRVWDTRTGECIATLERTCSDPRSWDALMAFAHDGNRLLVTTSFQGDEACLVDWDLLTGEVAVLRKLAPEETHHLLLLDDFIEALAAPGRVRVNQHVQVLGDKALVAAYASKPQLRHLPRPTAGERWCYAEGLEEEAVGMTLHPESERVAFVGNDREIVRDGWLTVMDSTTGAIVVERELANQPWCVAYSSDGSVLAIGTNLGRVLLFETKYYTQQLEWVAHDHYVYSLSWTADDSRLITASGDTTLRVWDTRTRVVSLLEEQRWSELQAEVAERVDLLETFDSPKGMKREAARIELIRRAQR